MQVIAGGRLNLNGPAPKSLGVLSIALNGNPADTLFAIKVGTDPASGWLQFVDSGTPWNRIDLYPAGTAPEWHTAAEWADKRLRGLAVDTAYAFSAKAQNAVGEETALAGVGSYATNMHCDVNRSGAATVLDLVLARDAALAGGTVGTVASWACDVNDDGCVDVSDLSALRSRILNP